MKPFSRCRTPIIRLWRKKREELPGGAEVPVTARGHPQARQPTEMPRAMWSSVRQSIISITDITRKHYRCLTRCGTDRQSGTIIMQLPMREWAIISARCRTSSRQWRWIRRTCSTGDCSSSCSSAVSGTRIWDGDMDLAAVRREPGTAAVSAVPVFAV